MSSNSRYKTHTGREFNMSAFAEKNGDTKAVGNSSMNARGDIIDAKGNVKIPSQTISRAVSDIQNNQSRQVSLKADDTINIISNKAQAELSVTVVASRVVDTASGPATETEFSDGSIQVTPIISKPTSL